MVADLNMFSFNYNIVAVLMCIVPLLGPSCLVLQKQQVSSIQMWRIWQI